jgi:hypothetical protein
LSHAKNTFLQLALTTHPDVVALPKDFSTLPIHEQEVYKKKRLEDFIRYRDAFDMISSNKLETNVSTNSMKDTDEQHIQSFLKYNHTTVTGDLSSLDPKTLLEVAQVSQDLAQGGLDRGGLWAYAHQIHRDLLLNHKDVGAMQLSSGDGGGDNTDAVTHSEEDAASRKSRTRRPRNR